MASSSGGFASLDQIRTCVHLTVTIAVNEMDCCDAHIRRLNADRERRGGPDTLWRIGRHREAPRRPFLKDGSDETRSVARATFGAPRARSPQPPDDSFMRRCEVKSEGGL
ncbi:hypothetical protein [Burkholderia ubonensis]|uniref:hypothetical protein n=1 Tax=Burkholderia ubonensis TaxID=101571 RepID=UPI000ACF7163|nr:hypothetical protein [Burkholderia ubonensis]